MRYMFKDVVIDSRTGLNPRKNFVLGNGESQGDCPSDSRRPAMNNQNVIIGGKVVSIPNYYQRVESMPEDPEGSVPFAVQTENAMCVVFLYPVDESQSLPRRKEALVNGIRQYLGENQGLIQVDAGEDYAYSIVKTLKEQGGVQYILTLQRFYPEFILNIQGYFEEIGVTGIRDNMVYEYCRRQGLVGNDGDSFAGWARDPYDEKVTTGALMNLSELKQFDEKFPGFPLSMCREFLESVGVMNNQTPT